MPKRKSCRASSRAHGISPKRKAIYYSLLLTVSLLFLGIALGSSFKNTNVLGEQTFLAKGGDDSGGDDSSGSNSSGSSSSDNSDDDDRSGSTATTSNTGSGGSSGSDGRGRSVTTSPVRTNLVSPKPTGEEGEDESDEEDDVDEEENEVELPDEIIEVKTKDDRTRIDIVQNGIKIRLERRADRVVIKAEREDGTEVELEDDALFKIDDRLAKSGIKIETAGDNEFFVQRGNTVALTNFPISLDLATNSLIINTPAGQKTVAVLPDVAVQNLLAANIVDRLTQAIQNDVTNNTLPSVDQLVTLGEQNGVLVYEINGIDNQRLLGIIPVVVQKEVVVSAETGEVVETQTSFVDSIIDLISF